MSRINVDEEYWSDPRRVSLILKLKSALIADGAMLNAWKAAERFWFERDESGKAKNNPVPKEAWIKIWDDPSIGDSIIESGLARSAENGIYVCGVSKRFAWRMRSMENGKLGGRPRKQKKKTQKNPDKPKETQPNPEKPNLTQPNPKKPYSSSSSSSSTSLSSSTSDSTSSERESHAAGAAPRPDRLASLWNRHCKKLPKVLKPEKLSAARGKHSKARWTENPDEGYWVQVITRLADSEFCNGRNDRAWVADFGFLVKPDTHEKVLEGRYDSRGSPGRTRSSRVQENLRSLAEKEGLI